MAITNKTLIVEPYYVPLSYHILMAYTVFTDAAVVVATVASFYSQEAAQSPRALPLHTASIAIKGRPASEVESWIYSELTRSNDGTVEIVDNPYDFQVNYQLADRFIFAQPVSS